MEKNKDCRVCGGTGWLPERSDSQKNNGTKCSDCKGTGRELVRPDGAVGNEGPRALRDLLRF